MSGFSINDHFFSEIRFELSTREITDKDSPMPKLLISVKNETEAVEAIQGGADILDIKDPLNGPLGMAEAETIENISDICERHQGIQTSAALGELEQWCDSRSIPACLNRLDYLKVGPGNSIHLEQWFEKLVQTKTRFQDAGICHPCWIAVLYADREAGTILQQSRQSQYEKLVERMVNRLKEHHFAGLLIDTAQKWNGSLRKYFSNQLLLEIIGALHSGGKLCSLAGRLTFQEIESLIQRSILPDYYAVRSAVCAGGDRQANIESQRVKELKTMMNRMTPKQTGLSQ